MKKISLLLLVFFVIFSCKKNNFTKSDALLFKEYISGFSTGFISTDDPIRVILAKPFDEEKFNNLSANQLFEIEPSIEGEIQAEGNEIKFIPKQTLSQNTEYQITFNLFRLFDVESKLERFNFEVRTQKYQFEVSLEDLQSYSREYYYLNAHIEASDNLDPNWVKQMVSATVNGKSLSIKTLTEEKSSYIPIIIDSIPAYSDREQKLLVKWNGDAYDIESQGEISMDIPANNSFGVVQLLKKDGENNNFSIVFSSPLDKNQDFRGLVYVEDKSDFKFTTSGNTLKVYSDEYFENDVEITVHQGVKSKYGDKTESIFRGKLTFEPMKPEVRFVRNGTILPSSQNLKINFQTINLKAVEVTVSRIYQNNILQFLQDNELNTANKLYKVAATIARKVIPIQATGINSLSKWNTHALDLSSLIKPEPGAMYRVVIDFKKEYSISCNNDKTPIKEENISIDDDKENFAKYDDYDDYYDDYDDYNWDERDDPCKNSYYYNRAISTNVLASDLGVIVKRGQTNNYLVVVNDILSTSPISGAKIELYDYQQQKLQEGTTNAEGIAEINTTKKAYFAIVRKDNNTTYVKIDDGNSLSVSNFDVNGLQLEKGRNGYIYTERGVWRPGDSISVGFIFNDFSNKLPENHPIKLIFSDPNGKTVQQIVKNSNTDNHYLFSLKTPSDAITGNWNCQIKVGASTYYKTIKIETIKPNRLKIKNSLADALISIQGINASLQVDWLQGSPASNSQVEITAKVYAKPNPFKGYENFVFSNKSFPFSSEEINVFNGKTNENGQTSFFFQPQDLQASEMLKVNFLTKANEQGGDFSTDVCSATLSPFESYVGIKAPIDSEYAYYETSKVNKFQVVVLSEKGKPLANHNVKLYAYKIESSWWWDVSQLNISSYNSSEEKTPAFTMNATTKSDGKAFFDIRISDRDYGRYFFLVEDEESEHQAGIDARFYSWASSEKTGSEATMLMLTTNKKEYTISEEATITFPSDAGSKALISIENGSKILKTYWVDTQKGSTRFSFPITEDMAPNVYLYVTLLQPHAQTKNDSPIRLYGVAPISVYNPKTKLEPEIQMANVLRPEKKATIKVKEKSGKPMTYTLAIVEDGLLDLTRFKTPQPWNAFFMKTALGVKTWDIYNDVIGAFGGTINQVLSIGGDEDLGGAKAQKANRFKPLVIVKGPFKSNGETQSHDISLPNYIGSVRVMVIASDVQQNAFGTTDKTIPVYSPLMVLGSLPRKAVPGETITLPVTVFAKENQVKNVSVKIKTNEKFKLISDSHQQVKFDKIPDEKMAYFTLKANEIGIGKVTIEATSGNEKATYEVEMDIFNPNPQMYQVKSIVLQPNSSQNIDFEVFGEKSTNSTTLEVSSFPGVNLAQRLKYLIDYPHGCGEQVTSGAFPQLYLSDFEKLTSNQQQEIQKNISAAIRKLSDNQLSNGGFSYWKGENYVNEWVTCYIGQFYIEAEKKGFSLPIGSKDKWIDFQKNTARSWVKNSANSEFLQAYRLYTLALAKQPDMASMNRLREMPNLSNQALSRLAATYALTGQKQIAEKLFAKVVIDNSDDNDYGYGSELRNQAMALETSLLIGKQQLAADLALKISEKLSSNEWLSTQTSAYSLYAMALYVAKNKTGKSWELNYQLGKDKGTVNSQTGFATKKFTTHIGSNKINVHNKSGVTLYTRVINSGILPVGKEITQQNGLSIKTNFSNKGNTISEDLIKQGTAFVCTISVTNTTQSNIENVALTQFIPSGWEIINTRYNNYETEKSNYDYLDIRDDRANFYFSLKAQETKQFQIKLNASYKGTYYLSGTFAEAMYNVQYNTRNAGKWIKVE